MTPMKSDRTLMKQSNQQLVLQLIQGRGPISRKDIAQLTGLSPAAVSGITAELIERGLVLEVGEAETEGRAGRRAVLLRLNAHAGYVVGVKYSIRAIDAVLTDLDANVLYTISLPFAFAERARQSAANTVPNAVVEVTVQTIEQLLAKTAIEPAKLVGIGVAINGIVDAEAGISRFAPHFGWRDAPLAAPLAARFNIPVYLENDARALAIAEQWFGVGRDVDTFLVVAVGYGIGGGFVVNGRLHRGALGGAGEFGHLPLLPDGPICSCGKPGCLESLAAEPAIIRQAQAAVQSGVGGLLAQLPALTPERIVQAAAAGDEAARRVLRDAGAWLGVGLASLVNVLNPKLIVITGEAVHWGSWYFEAMEEQLRARAFDGLAEVVQIVPESGGNELWARGAACVVLGELFGATPRADSEALRISFPLA